MLISCCLALAVGLLWLGSLQAYGQCLSGCVAHDVTGNSCTGADCSIVDGAGVDGCSNCDVESNLATTMDLSRERNVVLAFIGGALDVFATPAYANHGANGATFGYRDNRNQSGNGQGEQGCAQVNICYLDGHDQLEEDATLAQCNTMCEDDEKNVHCTEGTCQVHCGDCF